MICKHPVKGHGSNYMPVNVMSSAVTLNEVAACQDWISRAENLIYLSKSLFLGLTIVQKALKKRPEHSRVWGQVLGEAEGIEHRGSSTRTFPSVLFCFYSISKPGTTRAHAVWKQPGCGWPTTHSPGERKQHRGGGSEFWPKGTMLEIIHKRVKWLFSFHDPPSPKYNCENTGLDYFLNLNTLLSISLHPFAVIREDISNWYMKLWKNA